MPTYRAKMRRNWKVVLAYGAITVAFVAQGVLLNNTINDVNHDRLVSCVRTYEGIREVFRPFFRPPEQRTAKERRDIAKFNRSVDYLKKRCGVQTGVKGAP